MSTKGGPNLLGAIWAIFIIQGPRWVRPCLTHRMFARKVPAPDCISTDRMQKKNVHFLFLEVAVALRGDKGDEQSREAEVLCVSEEQFLI